MLVRSSTLIAFVSAAAVAGAALSVSPRVHARDGMAPQAQARGGPIFDCPGMTDSISRLAKGLPVQDEWIRRTEEQLLAAEQGNLASQAERNSVFRNALQDLATTQIEQALTLRRQVEALQSAGLNRAARRAVLERIDAMKSGGERLEELKQLHEAGAAGVNFGEVLRKNAADLRSFATFLQDSGISDELASSVATYAVPGVGALVVETFKVVRDLGFAQWKVNMTASEAHAARRNLDDMRAARNDVSTKIYEYQQTLRTGCPQSAPRDAARTVEAAPQSTPVAPVSATPPAPGSGVKRGSGGGGQALVYGSLAAVVGGAYLYKEYSGAQCTAPADIGGYCLSIQMRSSECQQWLAERKTYCSCLGLTSNGGNCQ